MGVVHSAARAALASAGVCRATAAGVGVTVGVGVARPPLYVDAERPGLVTDAPPSDHSGDAAAPRGAGVGVAGESGGSSGDAPAATAVAGLARGLHAGRRVW